MVLGSNPSRPSEGTISCRPLLFLHQNPPDIDRKSLVGYIVDDLAALPTPRLSPGSEASRPQGRKMIVLSLFDGMSCGQIALNRAGVKYDRYLASEIDRHAIEVAQRNYPLTEHIGSVVDLKTESLPKVDLLMGGSPCQSFSIAGSCQGVRTGFEGKSGLFWEFARVLRETNPTHFLLENVVMKKEWMKVITDEVKVEPREISSSVFLPQARRRLYWTNIPFEEPAQREYDARDIIEGDGFPSSCDMRRFFRRKEVFNTLTATYYKGIRAANRPAVSLRESCLDDDREAHRMLTPEECERLQSVPSGYTAGASKTQRYKMLGNGWTVDVIAHIFKPLARKAAT